MNAPRIQLALLLLGSLLAAPWNGYAQDEDYTAVETKELVKNPQWFWAKGIAFRDILMEHPSRGTTRLGERLYQELTLKAIGECYADTDVVPALNEAELNKEYVFTGTVYQRGRKYVVAIQSMVAQVRALDETQDVLKKAVAEAEPTDPQAQTIQAVNDLISAVQTRLLANAQERETTLAELLKPDSQFADSTLREIRNAIQALADERKQHPAELLAQYIAAVLALQNRPPPAPATNELEALEPGAAADQPAVEEPPKRRGFFHWPWSRRDEPEAPAEIAPAAESDAAPEPAPVEPEAAKPAAAAPAPAEPVAPAVAVTAPESAAPAPEPAPAKVKQKKAGKPAEAVAAGREPSLHAPAVTSSGEQTAPPPAEKKSFWPWRHAAQPAKAPAEDAEAEPVPGLKVSPAARAPATAPTAAPGESKYDQPVPLH